MYYDTTLYKVTVGETIRQLSTKVINDSIITEYEELDGKEQRSAKQAKWLRINIL